MNKSKAWAWVLALILPCYLIDQGTKALIMAHLDIGEGVVVLPGVFEILHVRNTGAAFGILQGIPDPFRTIFFLIITVVACVAVYLIFRQSEDKSILLKVTVCLILAGALGNLTDRLLRQEVVDFLNVHYRAFRWPTFNVADMYITVGMIGLLYYTFTSPKTTPKPGGD